jgi:hypothetical protein
MNPKSIFNLFSLKGKAQALVQQGISTLIISSVVFSLVALTGYVRIAQASGPGGQPSIEMLRNTDPADRKFFTPGYGVQASLPKEIATLPAVDPADRKFFTPGYGTQTVMPGEPEVLPTVDPADRKFFSAGYGTQTVMSSESEALPTIDPADRKFFQPSIIFFQK